MFESDSGSSSVTGPGSSLDKSDSSGSSSDSGEDRKIVIDKTMYHRFLFF